MIEVNTTTYLQIKELDKEYSEKIRNCNYYGTEDGHDIADNKLLELLKELGFDKTVKEFVKLNKWYS